MNLETLAIESQDMLTTHQTAGSDSEQTGEIKPIAMECFKLVGGGSSIVLLG